jgi:DNA-directed RNA polymerase specialized sigma24 family protein
MNEETKRLVAQMYNEGCNPEDIAEELGLDEVKVMDYCSDLL